MRNGLTAWSCMEFLLLTTVDAPNILEIGIFAIAISVKLGMTTLHLSVDRNVGVPIHRQVYDGLRRAILDGRLRPGQRIPSSRSLATDLGVSRLPVLSAYEQLLHEGYLVGRTGSGTFVSEAVPDDLLHPVSASGRVPSRRLPRGATTRKPADRPTRSSWN